MLLNVKPNAKKLLDAHNSRFLSIQIPTASHGTEDVIPTENALDIMIFLGCKTINLSLLKTLLPRTMRLNNSRTNFSNNALSSEAAKTHKSVLVKTIKILKSSNSNAKLSKKWFHAQKKGLKTSIAQRSAQVKEPKKLRLLSLNANLQKLKLKNKLHILLFFEI